MNSEVIRPIRQALDAAFLKRSEGENLRGQAEIMIHEADREIGILQQTLESLEAAGSVGGAPPSMREIISWKYPGEHFTIDQLVEELARSGNQAARTSVQSMISRMKSEGELESAGRGVYAIPSHDPYGVSSHTDWPSNSPVYPT